MGTFCGTLTRGLMCVRACLWCCVAARRRPCVLRSDLCVRLRLTGCDGLGGCDVWEGGEGGECVGCALEVLGVSRVVGVARTRGGDGGVAVVGTVDVRLWLWLVRPVWGVWGVASLRRAARRAGVPFVCGFLRAGACGFGGGVMLHGRGNPARAISRMSSVEIAGGCRLQGGTYSPASPELAAFRVGVFMHACGRSRCSSKALGGGGCGRDGGGRGGKSCICGVGCACACRGKGRLGGGGRGPAGTGA